MAFCICVVLCIGIMAGASAQTPPTNDAALPGIGPVTGFALPRYVSVKSSQAYARRGPSQSHRIDWVFQRRHMPLRVVAEFGHWRRVEDRDGAGGWVHHALLSGRRTAIVEIDLQPIHFTPLPNSPVSVRVEAGVIVHLRECRNEWCLVEAEGYRGWIDAHALWGVDRGETFED
jgi:SH3-like domain-containing protein